MGKVGLPSSHQGPVTFWFELWNVYTCYAKPVEVKRRAILSPCISSTMGSPLATSAQVTHPGLVSRPLSSPSSPKGLPSSHQGPVTFWFELWNVYTCYAKPVEVKRRAILSPYICGYIILYPFIPDMLRALHPVDHGLSSSQ